MKSSRQRITFWGVLRSLAVGIYQIATFFALLGLAIYSMFAVHVLTRETLREIFPGEEFEPCGVGYFLGPAILVLMFFGFLKLKEINPSKKQKGTVSEFCLRAATALAEKPQDFKLLGKLYGEGLLYRNQWGADTRLNEMIGILRYMVERESAKRFIEQSNVIRWD